MAKIKVEILPAHECLQRSRGTDKGTAGWWIHGTTEPTARAILNGKKKVHSPFWLTRNPDGASQHHGKTILWCTVKLCTTQPPKPSDDKYKRKGKNEGLDQPYEWIGVVEGKVFIASSPPDSEKTFQPKDEKKIPTVVEELQKIIGKSSN